MSYVCFILRQELSVKYIMNSGHLQSGGAFLEIDKTFTSILDWSYTCKFSLFNPSG